MNSAISSIATATPADTSSATGTPNHTQTASAAPDQVVYKNPQKQAKPVVTEIKRKWKGKEIVYWQVRVGSSIAKVYATPTANRVRYSVVYWMEPEAEARTV